MSALLHHEAFTLANPNRVRSLIGAFAQGNPTGFHRADGAGYAFVADHVLALDKQPAVASLPSRSAAGAATTRSARTTCARSSGAFSPPGLSRDVYEIEQKRK